MPTLDHEENPDKLIGYIKLVKIFSAPDKNFHDRWNSTIKDVGCSKEWLQSIQHRREQTYLSDNSDNIQRVDI